MNFQPTKINKLRTEMQKNEIDISFITDFKTIQYLTTFSSDPLERILVLVIFADDKIDPFIFVPALEHQVALNTGWPFEVYSYQDNQDGLSILISEIKNRLDSSKKIAVEKNNLSVAKFEFLKSAFIDSDFSINLTPIIEKMRLLKDSDEIEKLIQAGNDADYAFEVGFNALKIGKTELQIAAEIEFAVKMKNIPAMSFPTLIQTGAHAADPHGETSSLKLQENKLVLFDLGTVNQGYISDATRTVAFGKVDDFTKDVHQVVLEAQLKAQLAAKPGITAAELDAVARDVITKAGFGEYFIHRLGHGIGMSEHEYPSIMEGNDLVIEPTMAFSIEPGIYIPGKVGVRIEDSIVITENGNIPLTKTDKTLLEF